MPSLIPSAGVISVFYCSHLVFWKVESHYQRLAQIPKQNKNLKIKILKMAISMKFCFCMLIEIWGKQWYYSGADTGYKEYIWNNACIRLSVLLCSLYEQLSIPKENQTWESKILLLFILSMGKGRGKLSVGTTTTKNFFQHIDIVRC